MMVRGADHWHLTLLIYRRLGIILMGYVDHRLMWNWNQLRKPGQNIANIPFLPIQLKMRQRVYLKRILKRPPKRSDGKRAQLIFVFQCLATIQAQLRLMRNSSLLTKSKHTIAPQRLIHLAGQLRGSLALIGILWDLD